MGSQSMSAARLRYLAEKATSEPWRSVFHGFNIGSKRRMSVLVKGPSDGDDCADYRAWVASNGTHDDAALIVHLRNRAQLYADLIEAAARFRSEAWSASCTIPPYLQAALAAIDAADKEGV